MKLATIRSFGVLTILSLTVSVLGSVSHADVPREYYPNYQIADAYDTLLQQFVEVEAVASLGEDIPPSLFADMNRTFSRVFPALPQSSTNQIIYRQCELITQQLSSGVDNLGYLRFKDRCFTPLGGIISDVNTNYTIKANATANPKQGSSPLNVTFDARASTDPSNDTIPSDNYYWYYTDTDGDEQTIGKGPVVNYTFNEPGNQIVHLTVRSVNSRSEGIFDGETSLSINVAPKAAEIILYVGGKKANADSSEIVKLGAGSAESGILLDATSTRPTGARTIQSHRWTITNDSGYTFTSEGEGRPGEFIHRFPANGIYTIKIDIQDNENNRISEKYKISISDPVAIIKQNPMVGSTSTEFTFDGSTSYAITSRIKTYQRTVTDPNGTQTERIEGKQFKRKFMVPGMYTIRLTVIDEDGSSSFETRQISVGSTPPLPSFTITPQSELSSPSQYIFDATSSFDEDVRTGSDELSYEWLFSNNENVTIQRTIENDNSIIKVSFEQPGPYKIKLVVEDAYGEMEIIEKELDIESTLRPQLVISPQVGMRGEPVIFAAKANKPVAFYERSFGDGESQQTKTPRVEHTYTKAGVYTLKLRVVTAEGEENTLTRQVFMGQKDMPLVGYEVKQGGNTLLQPTMTCPSGSGDTQIPAYESTRYENIQIDASMSRNAQGLRQDLNLTFQPKNDKLYKTSNLNYSFPELGCTQITLFVEDTNLGKTSEETITFKVVNAPPELDNLTISFPQTGGGSPVGVGTDTTSLSQQQLFTDPSVGSVVVRVKAKGARDPDGFISHYRRWYYPSGDPSRKEDFKITPSDVPYATFVVPKPPYATEYAFAVELIDNDDGRTRSEDIVGKGPIVFFPPGEGSLDIPIVTMKASSTTTRIGEEVTFTVDATILSDRPDFASERYFKYDFDGDGEYDISSTKQSTITHTYTQATDQGAPYRPRVAVYYRGRAGIGTTQPITVLRGLKPRFEVNSSGKTILLQDFSLGDIVSTSVCVNERQCGDQLQSGGSGSGLIYTQTPFVHTYDSDGTYTIVMQVSDEYGNTQIVKQIVTIDQSQTAPLLSMPGLIPVGSGYELMIGNATNNTVSFYLPGERCFVHESGNDSRNNLSAFIDLDITTDTNMDGNSDIDHDVPCGQLITRQLMASSQRQEGIIYQGATQYPLTLVFEGYMSEIPPEYQAYDDEIQALITSIGSPISANEQYIVQLLDGLSQSLGETDQTNSILIQLNQLLEENPQLLDIQTRQRLETLIQSLGDDTVIESLGGNEYSTAKSNIIGFINEPYKQQVVDLFTQFEQLQDNKPQSKSVLDQIFTTAGTARDAGAIDPVDFAFIQTNLCDIIIYFELPSRMCRGDDPSDVEQSAAPDESEGSGSVLKTILKRTLIIVGILAVIIIGMIVFFAIRARRQSQQEEETTE